jgi:hypothetical protein
MSETPETTNTPAAPSSIFALNKHRIVTLSDGVTTVTVKALNEGERRVFSNATQKPFKLSQEGEAEVTPTPGDDRHALFMAAISAWSIQRDGEDWPFSPANKRTLLLEADSDEMDKVEEAAREINPFLLDDVTVDSLDEEIEKLQKLREEKAAEEAGNA